MRDFLRFLRERPAMWLVPIVVAAALLVWLAWKQSHTPVSPFTYEP